ncbi:hypothetical protein [Zobellia sp. 1_MG-2023]|uniref:hypothetical protein n=1 Tax=Zobellia sp. 1_MG-2023 TaxID=3062626 RepID=UPI0026E381D1|nr:hypothetical protein [Zobellia sp. 1_MG-2023]MDO6819629.1 hypothetical protein [Zobellia sp. 1_MG-2023]
MKKYLYYPNLEPPNTEWLKFSLLYLEKFESIVPYNRQHLISDNYRQISNETDLVELYPPTYQQGERASEKAIWQAEKILERPYRASGRFNRINLYRDWRDRANWNYQIFSEKFSYQFGQFCVANRIGQQNVDGLLLPKELAFMFMTHLAQEISYERDGSIITDNREFDNYTNYSRVFRPSVRKRHEFIKGILNLQVPTNISEISFDKLIEFRNKNRDRISEFNRQIELVEDSIGNGLTEQSFIDSFNNANEELMEQILLLGTRASMIPLATYMLISDPNALSEEYARNILTSLGIGLGGYFAVKKSLINTQSKRSCKKYLTNVSLLK